MIRVRQCLTKKNSLLLFGFCFIFIFLFIAGYTPQFARQSRPESEGRDNMGITGWYPPDYRVYLSAITLGKNGFWLFRNPFTTEDTPALPYYLSYILLGKLTAPLNLFPPVVYHLAKTLSIILITAATYYIGVFFLVKKSKALLATIFSLLVTTQPDIFYNQTIATTFTMWWTDQIEAIQRLHNRPHYVQSQAFLALAVLFYLKTRKSTNIWNGVIFSLCSLVTAILVPTAILPLFLVIAGDMIIQFILVIFRRISIQKAAKALSALFLLFPTLAALWIMRGMAYLDPVWTNYNAWEISWWNQDYMLIYHLYISFLPLLLMILIGIPSFLRKSNHKFIYLFLWAFTPLILYPVINKVDISIARLIFLGIHIPLGILAIQALSTINIKWKSLHLRTVITTVFVIYSFVMLGIAIQKMWIKVLKTESPYDNQIYITSYDKEAIIKLKTILPKNARVVTGTIMGNLMPGFVPVITNAGHQGQTLMWPSKVTEAVTFFSGGLSDEAAYAWLQKNKISYVVDDGETKMYHSGLLLPYSFLRYVWDNGFIHVYEVVPKK